MMIEEHDGIGKVDVFMCSTTFFSLFPLRDVGHII